MEWNSEIKEDGQDFSPLPQGEYAFRVLKMDRTKASTGANMAKLELEVQGDGRTAKVYDNLVLQDNCEWKLSQFFRAIGQKKHGQSFRMDWNRVPGARGRVRLKVEEYEVQKGEHKGEKRQRNAVDSYLDPPSAGAAPAPAATAAAEDDGLM